MGLHILYLLQRNPTESGHEHNRFLLCNAYVMCPERCLQAYLEWLAEQTWVDATTAGLHTADAYAPDVKALLVGVTARHRHIRGAGCWQRQ